MLLALRSLWEEQASSGVVTGTSAVTAAPGRRSANRPVEYQLVGGKKRKLPKPRRPRRIAQWSEAMQPARLPLQPKREPIVFVG